MDDQRLFMELLNDVVNIARTNDNTITTKEITAYFSDIELTEEQLENIYDYLCKSNITVKGYVRKMSADATGKDMTAESSVRLKQYRKYVRELEVIGELELESICCDILEGIADEVVKHKLIEKHLVTVINMAAKYANRGVSSDELIEEGNLALVVGVKELHGMLPEHDKMCAADICEDYIRKKIRTAIIQYIDGFNEEESELYATIAKTGLVSEAVKKLAEEYGRVATIEELSEYTHIPVSEIQDIISISGDTIEVGK